MQKRWLLYVLVALLVGSLVSAAKVEEDVAEELENSHEVRVIVQLKKDAKVEHISAVNAQGGRAVREQLRIGKKTFTMEELGQKRILKQGFAAEITKEAFEKLRDEPAVESIEIDEQVKLFLTDSVPLINANDVWNIQVNSMNSTGRNQAICIIDTGVDYTHESLGGCSSGTGNINLENCSKVPSGYDFFNNDNNPIDDHGHGTHVSGIAAANGTITGVAPSAQIIALKVLNSAGSGFTSDVVAAIEWCTYNATKFNITVVSMSLGGSTVYNSDCDINESSYTIAVDAASMKNISIVAAAGNVGSTTSISAPACVHNVTSVGWTSKSDAIASSSNAGPTLDVLAPGSSIVSAALGSGTATSSGTSMSTPHVAGAYALLRHFYRMLSGKQLRDYDVERALKTTGTIITDTRNEANNNYARIDAYAALIYLNSSPLINFVYPTLGNGNATRQTNVTINITSDKELVSPVLEFNNVNYSMSILNVTNYFYSIVVADGLYNYRVYANDSVRLNITAVRTVRVDTIVPNVSILSPKNGSNHTSVTVNLNFSIVDSSGSSVCVLTNSTGQNTTISCANTTFAAHRGLQNITLYVNDTAGNMNATTVFFTVNLPPQLVIVHPQNATYANKSIALNFTATDEDLGSIWYNLDDGTNTTITANITFNATAGQHTLTLYANDTLHQLNKTQVVFSVDIFGPDITFVATTPNNETYNTTNIVIINVTLSENGTAVLEFGGSNETMNGGGTNYYSTKELSDGNYSFRVYANDTSSNPSVSARRFVTIRTVKNESSFFQQISSANVAVSALRLLRGTIVADASNVSLLQNYTLEFNRSGVLIHVADFKWSEANTAGVVNVTQNVSVAAIEANVTNQGGVLNQTVWIEINNFVSNYTPRIIFDKKYRLFYYINGTVTSPTVTRITAECTAGFGNRPCYALGESNSTMYLSSFSGASAASDVEFPTISVSSPAAGASFSSTSVALNYIARDNVAVDTCQYQLNTNANVSGCSNVTMTAAEGSNTVIIFVNDTSGNRNSSSVTFTVSTSSGGSGGGGGGSGGGGGGGGGGGSSSRRKTAPVPVVLTEGPSTPSVGAAGGVPEVKEEPKPCSVEFDALAPVSLVAQNNARGSLKYKGTCALADVRVRLDGVLEEKVHVTAAGTLSPATPLEIVFERNARARDKIPALITGNVVDDRLTRLTARAVETVLAAQIVTGNVIIEARLPDGTPVAKEVPIEISVFAAEKAVVPAVLGVVGFIVMMLVGLAGIKVYRNND